MSARRLRRRALAALLLALAGTGVAACGKKPGFVLPPQGEEADRFPRTYPNPIFDPAAEQPAAGPGTGTMDDGMPNGEPPDLQPLDPLAPVP